MSSQMRLALGVLALVVAGCGTPASAPAGDSGEPTPAKEVVGNEAAKKDAKTKTSEESMAGKKTDFECPVTIPPEPGFVAAEPKKATYSEHFPVPDPWPNEYPHEGMVWYGSEGLWTALAVDGDHGERKSVWWSVNFPGGIEEEQPEVWVTWTRLDKSEPVTTSNDGKATNAFTPAEGWFMIAGIDPSESGCWEVEATYKGTTLSYVYENTG